MERCTSGRLGVFTSSRHPAVTGVSSNRGSLYVAASIMRAYFLSKHFQPLLIHKYSRGGLGSHAHKFIPQAHEERAAEWFLRHKFYRGSWQQSQLF